jgi:hypothetical protein
MRYYICDIRKPNEVFYFAVGNGEYKPAIYADKTEAEKDCEWMNNISKLTRYAVREV